MFPGPFPGRFLSLFLTNREKIVSQKKPKWFAIYRPEWLVGCWFNRKRGLLAGLDLYCGVDELIFAEWSSHLEDCLFLLVVLPYFSSSAVRIVVAQLLALNSCRAEWSCTTMGWSVAVSWWLYILCRRISLAKLLRRVALWCVHTDVHASFQIANVCSIDKTLKPKQHSHNIGRLVAAKPDVQR